MATLTPNRITVVRGSVEYLSAQVADADGADLSGDMVSIAVHVGSAEDAVWLPAEWVEGASPATARTLAPVDYAADAYPRTSYSVSVKLTDADEAPIVRAGVLTLMS